MDETMETLVLAAQKDASAADGLIEQYMPFIRRETARFLGRIPQREEEVFSVAMLAFYEAIQRYAPGRGAFLSLAALSIRHRLTDFSRKERRHGGQISLQASWEGDTLTLEERLPEKDSPLQKREEERAAREEIEEFSRQLQSLGLTLTQVAEACPKQERTLSACMKALDFAKKHPDLLSEAVKTGKVPLLRLSLGAGVEKKTLERHRGYLLALLVAYTNGYEIIRGHIQSVKRKERA